jgi:TonB-linked SusC/RagA family outer membrane protein
MKKKLTGIIPLRRDMIQKIWLIMRLTAFFTFVLLMQVTASVYSQQTKLNLKLQDASLEQVFRTIQEQSDFTFFYKTDQIPSAKKVSVNYENTRIEDILERILQGTNLGFYILDHDIVITPRSGANERLSQQVIKITGKITDSNGEPLPGVTVVVKGTTQGTVTNADGNYSLTGVQANASLVFSFVGMKTQEEGINGRTAINIRMEEETIGLEEVVAIGYGSLRKSEMTTSVSSVKAEDIKNQVITSFEQALQGKTAGVVIREDSGEPGSGIEITIRGANSINGDNTPLYVVDGFPVNVGGNASGDAAATRTNPLSFLNPYDIERMEILKDAAATSVYGSRGSNGVILITTKQAKQGKTKIDFSSKLTFQTVDMPYKLLGASQYATVRNELARLKYPNKTEEQMWAENLYPYAGGYGSPTPHPDSCTVSSDFLDAILHNAVMQNYQLTLSGGNSENKHIISMGYTSQEGLVIDTDLKKANMRINLQNKIFPRFLLKTNLSVNYLGNSKTANSSGNMMSGPILGALRMRPVTPIFSEDGEPMSYDIDGSFIRNPVIEATEKYDFLENKDVILNIEGNWNIGHGFSFNSRVGGSYRMSTRDIFYPFNTVLGQTLTGQALTNLFTNTFFATEHFLQYEKDFKKGHRINAMIGLSYEQTERKTRATSQSQFSFDELGVDALALGTSLDAITSSRSADVLKSRFMRLNYNYKKTYLFNFTGRADGSSKFGVNNKWGFFPAGSVAWRAGNEKFIKKWNIFNELKLRGSWGVVGSQAIPNYRTADIYAISKYYLNYVTYTATYSSNLANADLKWESTESKNIGIDISVLKNRLNLTADYYIKDTRDLLTQRTLPTSSGYPSSWVNLGHIRNKGFEVEISAYPVNTTNFKWDFSANYSSGKTKVIDLGELDYIAGPQLYTLAFTMPGHRIIVGEELGLFYGYEADGLTQIDDFVDYWNGDRNPKQVEVTYTNQDGETVTEMKKSYVPVSTSDHNTPGQWKIKDANHDDLLSDPDMKILGKATPDFTIGWTNNFTFFKNWELSLFFQGAFGFQVLNLTKALVSGWEGANATQDWFEHRWTLDNQHNDVNYPSYGMISAIGKINNAMVEDGDYIKLKNLTLRYKIPAKTIKWLQSCAISFTGSNLLTLTKYSGQDPEVSSLGYNFMTPGVDMAPYPRPRSFTVGIDVTF